jgi:dihydropyrimidinase
MREPLPTRRDAIRSVAAAGAFVASGGVPSPLAAQPSARELLIRGGRVVNADGIRDVDVRIVGETIAEVGPRLAASAGGRVIDAAGRLVMPGGIDPHTHLHPSFVDDLASGSMAALAGGITTVGTFAAPEKGEAPLAALDRMEARVRAEAIADVILHLSSWPPSPELTAVIPALVERGQPSVKVYMTRADFGARLHDFIAQLEAARDAGVVTLAHCEDGALLAAAVRRLTAAGRTSLRDYGASRPLVAEVAATEQMAALCEDVGGPVYIVHLSSARALEACQKTRGRSPLYVETRPMYLHLTLERMQGADAPLFVGQPPLREQADRDALWRGLADGTIDVLATDHAPWTRAQKMDPALSIARVRPGVSDLQSMLPMYFSEGVRRRGLPLTRFVETTSTNAAKIFGLHPAKGVVRAGADADVVLWDPERSGTVTAETDLSNSDYSVYEGWKVTGWPVMTIRRGEVVFEEGRVLGSAGTGRLIARQRWR